MSDWFKKRLKEPTTFIGIGMIAQAAMILTKSDPEHISAVGQAAEQAAIPLSQGDFTSAGAFLLSGIMAILMSEKAK